METAIALSILLTVALASAPGAPGHIASTPSPSPTGPGTWNERAVPVVISLVDDSRAIENHTADPAHADPAWLASDDSLLRGDLRAAQRLQPPADRTMRAVWAATVARLWLADRTLDAAAANLDPAAVALAHQQFAVATDGLLGIGRAFSPRG